MWQQYERLGKGEAEIVRLTGIYHNLIRHWADTAERWATRNRRITALTALVLELTTRSEGYPPGDATLKALLKALRDAA